MGLRSATAKGRLQASRTGEGRLSGVPRVNTGMTMTITVKLNPKAVWDDGSAITSKDLECTWKANLNTPASISTTGYDKITSVDTSDPATAVINFKVVYAPYKNLFNTIIK